MRTLRLAAAALTILTLLSACNAAGAGPDSRTDPVESTAGTLDIQPGDEVIYLAGGCFWGVEEYFQRIPGVRDVISGYANGSSSDPVYGKLDETGHAETVKIVYDPRTVRTAEILSYYFRIIDPTSVDRQGNDVGRQYRTAIFYETAEVREIAELKLKEEAAKYDRPLVVEVTPLKGFYPAEEYHQDYLRKNPSGYCHIDLALSEVPLAEADQYPRPAESDLREKLSALSFDIVENGATEPAFSSELDQEFRPGIYVDAATGQPLFSSDDKYDSGCGWPSFTRPIVSGTVQEKEDLSLGLERTEVRSLSGSHLGHVFEDGPEDQGGLRYCINGAALRFIPLQDMEKEGYGSYLPYVRKLQP